MKPKMEKILLISGNGGKEDELVTFASRFATANHCSLVTAEKQIWRPKLEFSGLENGDGALPTQPSYIPINRLDDPKFAKMIRNGNFSMVIARPSDHKKDIQPMVNQLNCPVMLIPESLTTTEINRIVYLTDLRYAQRQIVQQLNPIECLSILLAHICEAGLPDLYPNYGRQLFTDTMASYGMGEKIMYTHIRDTDLVKIVDTLTSTLNADLLVFSNRKFDWQQALVFIPILIFPS